jgi:hypothetical protein
MAQFPLYDNLIENISTTGLDQKEKKTIVDNIKKMDADGHRLLFSLIRYHQYKTGNIAGLEAPYAAKKQKAGYKFDIDNLPVELQYVIQKFSDLHLKKMQEDQILHTPK